jgi:HEAT repeat protein
VVEDPHTVASRARDAVLAGFDAGLDTDLDAALSDPDPEVRVRALGAAQRRGVLDDARRVAALTDPDPLVRRRACALEVRSPTRARAVVDALIGLLADADPLVVVGAATALGEAAVPQSAASLSSIARTHPDARCREAAVGALGAIGVPDALGAILDALGDKPAVRRRAVVALAAFSGPDVERALRAALEDRDWQVREIALALQPDGEEPG